MCNATRYRAPVLAWLLAALLTGAAHATAIEEFARLSAEARVARESGDLAARERCVARIEAFLNRAPAALRAAAQVYAEAGDAEQSLAALSEFADLGQSDPAFVHGETFIALASEPRYRRALERMRENEVPIARSELAVSFSDPRLLAEDIDFDPKTRTFLVTSVLEKKIVRVTLQGRVSDFARSPRGWPMMALKLDATRRRVWATEVALDGFSAVPKSEWGRSTLLAFDLDSGVLLSGIAGPPQSSLGDMILTRAGRPIVSDGDGGGVYRLRGRTLERIDGGDFISPQTPALTRDERLLLVPDYVRGIGVLDLAAKTPAERRPVWLSSAVSKARYSLIGIDGLYLKGSRLIATQNGSSPERVIAFALDPARRHVLSQEIIERATPSLGDPTHGVVVGDAFYYIANAGWDHLDEHGEVKAGESLSPGRIMRYRLDDTPAG